MLKVQASILVFAPFRDDERMYPHLYDLLTNLRKHFDELIYLQDEILFLPYFAVDELLMELHSVDYSTRRIQIQNEINEKIKKLYSLRNDQKERLQGIQFKHRNFLVLAIDDNAFNCAINIFPNNTIYWSFDPLGKDSPYRLGVDGYVEALLNENAIKAHKNVTLVVQDNERKEWLEYCLGVSFRKAMFVPVALNDNNYCRINAFKRRHRGLAGKARIVQSGYICAGRFSLDLILAYSGWSDNFELNLRGEIRDEVNPLLAHSSKQILVSSGFYNNIELQTVSNEFDIGFIGYTETDMNHQLIVNASAQLVSYLQLGIPVICCGPKQLTSFIQMYGLGIASNHPAEITNHDLEMMVNNYSQLSGNCRDLYELHYDLNRIMDGQFFNALESHIYHGSGTVQ